MKKPVTLLLLAIGSLQAQAQLDSCNVFLKGKYVEAGIAQNGSFGSTKNSPRGYYSKPGGSPYYYDPCDTGYIFSPRPTCIGFITDPDQDGWAVGTPAFYGDFFVPGLPQEGWAISANGTDVKAYNSTLQTSGATGFSAATLTGSNTSYLAAGNTISGQWAGSLNMSAAAQLSISQNMSLDTSSLFITCNVTLRNTGTATVNNIYYMRTVEPDNDQTLSGDYKTINTVAYQLPNAKNRTMVTTTGTINTNAYMALGTTFCRAKCFASVGELIPSKPLNVLYNATDTITQKYNGSRSVDACVGLVFNIGSLSVGDSITFSYAYIFKATEVENALSVSRARWAVGGSATMHKTGDTATLCDPIATVDLSNTGQYTSWNWGSPTSTLISPTSGTHVNITLGTGIAIVYAIGSSATCPLIHDTVKIVLQPGGSAAPLVDIAGPHFKAPGMFVNMVAAITGAIGSYRIDWRKNSEVVLSTSFGNTMTYIKGSGTDTITATIVPSSTSCYDSVLSNTWYVYNSLEAMQANTWASNVQVYPNPLKNEMTVSDLSTSDQLTIYDMMGRRVMEWLITKDGNSTFNTKELQTGRYILRVLDKNGNIKAKLPIQKL